jgi:hypothetical protein
MSHLEPALRQAATPATIASLLVAHVTMRADIPTPMLISAIFLSIVLPKLRRVVMATLCVLYGLAFLPIGVFRAFRRDHPGDDLMQGLAKVTSLLNGVPLYGWAQAAAPAQVLTPPLAESVPPVIPASAALPAVRSVPAFIPASVALPRAKLASASASETREGLQAVLAERVEILPPALHAARSEREPLYDVTFTNLAERRPNGPSDVVNIESSVADTLPDVLADIKEPRGRHAKAEPQSVAARLAS